MLRSIDKLRGILVKRGQSPNHITPAMENLCGIIDGQNERLARMDEVLKRHTRQIHNIQYRKQDE